MTNIILFDSEVRDQLLPFTFTRPIGEIRIGILKIREKWEKWLHGTASYITQDYLKEKFPVRVEVENYVINGSILPNTPLCQLINNLELNEALLSNGTFIAAKLDQIQFAHLMNDEEIETLVGYEVEETPLYRIENIWDIFKLNGIAIESDFKLLTRGRKSQPISETNRVIGREQIFLEEGAIVECANLNATAGPIYIGKNAEVMEGCSIRGGFSLGANSRVKMSAAIYGGTTIGPHCTAGGEIKNVVMMGYSNKGHDGYLGNSVIGEWCNLGADTNNSNLKNNYSNVKVWNYDVDEFVDSEELFCGLFMGDHSKCGINTMFNTGTVVGVHTNIFGAGFPKKHIPSFTWGGIDGNATYLLDKAMEVGNKVYTRRSLAFDEVEQALAKSIFQQTTKYRFWEDHTVKEPITVQV